MNIKIIKSTPSGSVYVPPSKSHLHRLLIIAAFNEETTVINNCILCDDTQATLNCLSKLGASFFIENSFVTVKGINIFDIKNDVILDCKESASTLRLLLPVVLLSGKKISFTGSKRLIERTQKDIEEFLISLNADFSFDSNYLKVLGHLTSGNYVINCSVSSQLFSGLCIALSLLNFPSEIKAKNDVVSKSYIDLTVKTLIQFGFECNFCNNCFLTYSHNNKLNNLFTAEGDWSCASNFILLKNYGNVNVIGLNNNSLQPDKQCVNLIDTISCGFCDIDLNDCPDLAPVLFVAAALNNGACFHNVLRLKYKESDRLNSMITELNKCGVSSIIDNNCVTIIPQNLHTPKTPLETYNDHRIAMALSILSTVIGGEIKNVDCVSKSSPNFISLLKSLSIKVESL